MTTRKLSFYSFHCKFGEFNLIDFAESITIPAMLKDYTREFGERKYFFYRTRFIDISLNGEHLVGVAGKIVKDMTLRREQYYDEDRSELVYDERSIESSPSSFFFLIFNYHRLLFSKENRYSPSADEFASTCTKFYKLKRLEYIQQLYEENKDIDENISESRITKKYLQSALPLPKVEVVPLSSEDSFSEFVDRYNILRKVTVKLVDSNSEIDEGDLFERLWGQKSNFNADNTNLTHSTSRTEGLSKDDVKSSLAPISGQGNSKISLDGRDYYGEKLTGSNEKFKVTTEVQDNLGDNDINNRAALYLRHFMNFLEQGILRVSYVTNERIQQIISVFR
jgi:hypothetical protein